LKQEEVYLKEYESGMATWKVIDDHKTFGIGCEPWQESLSSIINLMLSTPEARQSKYILGMEQDH